jgi:hypothetical protein
LASSTDRSEDERALPRPELNPLVNPLLADNMGRWAEVYFTSAPEKREEAVVELLRELEAQKSDPESHSAPLHDVPARSAERVARAFGSPTTDGHAGDLRRCDTCGHDNPPRHQFCGMCGGPLSETAFERPMTGGGYNPQGSENQQNDAPAFVESQTDTEYREPIDEKSLPPAEEPRRDPYDLSPFHTLLERESAEQLEYDQAPSGRYRYIVGAMLAILIIALGYAAWRGSRSDQNAQGTPSQPPPAATDTAPAAATPNPAASAPSKPAEPQPAPSTQSAAQPATAKPAEPLKQVEPAAGGTHTAPTTATPTSQPAADLEYQGLQGNGADELAMAQRYLSSTSGRARDSAEAAKWLWKSIAKHNGPAMLVLADLYLKGDGVSKNCDQARVLLDSAALRGMAGAGARLRNLRAFGCQ